MIRAVEKPLPGPGRPAQASEPPDTWTIWFPGAGATGLLVARAQIRRASRVLLHAAPDAIDVEVTNARGRRIGTAKNLLRTRSSPICMLTRDHSVITREDVWPTPNDVGLPVILPGGEAGVLLAWWNSEDEKEWRWMVELKNRKGT